MKSFSASSCLSTALVLLLSAWPAPAADPSSAAEKQAKLIAILKSDAPPQDKAIPCKQLAIYGTKEAVPALAPLLADKDLASWARIALEAIPGPEADAALREALPKLNGVLLVGTINSLGVRRDARAVAPLAGKLNDSDGDVIGAAAAALGNIGGPDAAQALRRALEGATGRNASALAEGVILCAERFMTDGRLREATELYDIVRKADLPKQRRLEATRGAILARQSAGLPLLIEELRSPEKSDFGMALRTARELKGRDVTEALAAELDRAGSDRQVMLLLVLADRADAAVLPKLLQVAETGIKPTRVATLGLLDRFGNVSAVPVLLQAAADADTEIAAPAKATLTRMEGQPVDAALVDRLSKASGKTRQVIIELAALRRIHTAVPAIVPSLQDADPGVRVAALNTLGALGGEQQIGDLVRLLAKSPESSDRETVEGALSAICGRVGSKGVPQVMPLAKHQDSELRKSALRALATMGGPEALAAVAAAVKDDDESVRDEAVGTLATWPNNWPDDAAVAEPLLGLVKSGEKRAHQVQGVRGYLLYVQESRKLSNADKLKAVEGLLPLLKQAPEKRLAVAALGAIPTGQALTALVRLTGDPAIAEEACLAVVTVATGKGLAGADTAARRQALQTALDVSKNEATRQKAGDALKKLP